MKKLFSMLLFGSMLVGFSACEERTTTTTEVYQIVLVTDDLEGATAQVSKTDDVKFADEVKVTVTPNKSYVWEKEPAVTASHAICKSSTEKDGVYTFVFTAFEDNSVIRITGVAVTTEVYQVVLVTDDLEGATATVSKTDDIRFSDEVVVTVTPNQSYVWEEAPEVTASHATCQSSTEEDGVFTYVFTAFEDNSVIRVTGVASYNSTGTHNNHDYVDLGLPSGTLWATCNVGATNPEDYGDYFAWGETTTKSTYNWSTYKYGSDYDELTKYCTDSDYGYNGFTDNKTVLDPADDAATANWGGDWRMPTLAEQQELINECDWSWDSTKKGYTVTGKNGNSIFLPAAGCRYDSSLDSAGTYGNYWSSSLDEYYPYSAYYLSFSSDYYDWRYCLDRYYGQSVRPVCSSR